ADGAVVGAAVIGDRVAVVALFALIGLDDAVTAVGRRRNRGRRGRRRGRRGRGRGAAGGPDGRRRRRRGRGGWDGLTRTGRVASFARTAARDALAPLPESGIDQPVAAAGRETATDRRGRGLLGLELARECRAVRAERPGQLDLLERRALRPGHCDLG